MQVSDGSDKQKVGFPEVAWQATSWAASEASGTVPGFLVPPQVAIVQSAQICGGLDFHRFPTSRLQVAKINQHPNFVRAGSFLPSFSRGMASEVSDTVCFRQHRPCLDIRCLLISPSPILYLTPLKLTLPKPD